MIADISPAYGSCLEVRRHRCFAAGKGKNSPLVFLHGWGNDSSIWQSLTSLLEGEFELVFIDLPGFGFNRHVRFDSLESLLSQLEVVLPPKCHLVGWSLGGMIATRLADRLAERILSLSTIACNAKFSVAEDWPRACEHNLFKNFFDGFVRNPDDTFRRFIQMQVQGDKQRKRLLQKMRETMAGPGKDAMSSWTKTLRVLVEIDNRVVLPRLRCAHLAIFGECDNLVPVAVAKDFDEKHLCRKSLVIPNAGHIPQLSQPETLADGLRQFIRVMDSPYERDKKQVAQSFSQAAGVYDKIAILQKQVANRLVAIKAEYYGKICDFGCGTGFCIEAIASQYSEVIGLDIALGMLSYCQKKSAIREQSLICADIEQLPFNDNTLDGIVSSMSIQWCENLSQVFGEAARALTPKGWILFSTLGPGTLKELKNAWQAADGYTHINHFENQKAIESALQDAGFVIKHCSMETKRLEYGTVLDLMRELKAIGAHNVNVGKNTGLTTRSQLKRLDQAYESYRYRGKLPATYEVFYFLAYIKQ